MNLSRGYIFLLTISKCSLKRNSGRMPEMLSLPAPTKQLSLLLVIQANNIILVCLQLEKRRLKEAVQNDVARQDFPDDEL